MTSEKGLPHVVGQPRERWRRFRGRLLVVLCFVFAESVVGCLEGGIGRVVGRGGGRVVGRVGDGKAGESAGRGGGVVAEAVPNSCRSVGEDESATVFCNFTPKILGF